MFSQPKLSTSHFAWFLGLPARRCKQLCKRPWQRGRQAWKEAGCDKNAFCQGVSGWLCQTHRTSLCLPWLRSQVCFCCSLLDRSYELLPLGFWVRVWWVLQSLRQLGLENCVYFWVVDFVHLEFLGLWTFFLGGDLNVKATLVRTSLWSV